MQKGTSLLKGLWRHLAVHAYDTGIWTSVAPGSMRLYSLSLGPTVTHFEAEVYPKPYLDPKEPTFCQGLYKSTS